MRSAAGTYQLGRELVARQQHEHGLAYLEQAIRAAGVGDEPWLAAAYGQAMVALTALRRHTEAIALGLEGLRRLDRGIIWYQLGLAHLANGSDQMATSCLQQAIRRSSQEPIVSPEHTEVARHASVKLADISERQGRFLQAYDLAVRALRLRPDDPELRNRGEWLLRMAAIQADPKDLAWAGRPSEGTRLVFFTGPTIRPWDPTSLEPGGSGSGGSETAVIQIARELHQLGYRPEVYNVPCQPGVYDGVPYRPWEACNLADPCDVFVGVRVPKVFDAPINARLKWLWLQDTDQGGQLTPERVARMDGILVVSFWHKRYIRSSYGVPDDRLLVTRNGLDPRAFDGEELPRQRHRLMYSSSPDRGLDRVLAVWPRIRALWPDAELHAFCGWTIMDRSMEMVPSLRPELEAFKARVLAGLDQPGVYPRERVDQWQLAREFRQSDVWFYPTDFSETGCITALEAQAGGAIPVTTNVAVLPEIVRGGIVLPHDSPDDAYLEALQRLDDPALAAQLRRAGREFALTFSWANIAREWHYRMQVERRIRALA